MEKIEVITGKYRCLVGKQTGNHVNVFTNFRPLNAPLLLLELDASPSVEFITNVAYYGDNSGGLSVRLKDGLTVHDLIGDLTLAMETEHRDGSLAVEFITEQGRSSHGE